MNLLDFLAVVGTCFTAALSFYNVWATVRLNLPDYMAQVEYGIKLFLVGLFLFMGWSNVVMVAYFVSQ